MSRGTTKVYSSGATRKVSAFHLGSAADQISGHSKPQDAAPYKGQSYQQIKQQCLKDGVLFEDPEFKAENKSLFFSREPPRPFTWKRPKVGNSVCFSTIYYNVIQYSYNNIS